MAKPAWVTEWEKVLLAARSNRLGPNVLGPSAKQFVADIYAEMLLEIEKIVVRSGATLSPLVAQTLATRLRSIMQQTSSSFSLEMSDRIDRIIEGVAGAHEDAFKAAVKQSGFAGGFSAEFARVPQRAIEMMALRSAGGGISQNFRSLIATQWGNTFEQVDLFIAGQVGMGVSVETSKRRLAFMLASDSTGKIDPDLLRALQTRGVAGRRYSQLLNRLAVDPNHMGFPSKAAAIDNLARARGLLWKSRRIMLSEQNTAHSEAHREGVIESPVVNYMRWNLSGRHIGLPSTPDVCDTLAKRDLFGLGKGVYYAQNYPIRPHPNCGCFQGFVMRPISEWEKPKKDPTSPRRISKDDILNDYEGRIGDKAAKNLARRLNGQLKQADEAWRAGAPRKQTRRRKVTAPKPAAKVPKPKKKDFTGNPFRADKTGKWVDGKQAYDTIQSGLTTANQAVEANTANIVKASQDLQKSAKLKQEIFRALDDLELKARDLEELKALTHDEDGFLKRGHTKIIEGFLKTDDRFKGEYGKLQKKLTKALADVARKAEVLDGFKDKFKELNARRSSYWRTLEKQILFDEDEAAVFKSIAVDGTHNRAINFADNTGQFIEADIQDRILRHIQGRFGRLVGNKFDLSKLNVQISNLWVRRGFYSEVRGQNGMIALSDFDWQTTLSHEMGHFLENNVPEIKQKVRRFFRAKHKGMRTQPLNGLDKVSYYSANEKAFPVQSGHKAYMWKDYPTGDTEILSLMLQYLDAGQLQTLLTDEDVFILIWDLFR